MTSDITNLAAGSLRPYGGTGSEYSDPALVSVMGSVGYTLMDRYFRPQSACRRQ